MHGIPRVSEIDEFMTLPRSFSVAGVVTSQGRWEVGKVLGKSEDRTSD